MKKLILSVMLAAFAVAVQAGDDKANATQEKPACCAKAKTAAADKAECPMAAHAKGQCPYAAKSACKEGCCKEASGKQALLSPKAASEAIR